MKKLLLCLLFTLSACTINTASHTNGYTEKESRIARCGMGIDSNDIPAIQNMIDTNPEVKKQYENCLNQLSHN